MIIIKNKLCKSSNNKIKFFKAYWIIFYSSDKNFYLCLLNKIILIMIFKYRIKYKYIIINNIQCKL